MNHNDRFVVRMNRAGELVQDQLHDFTLEKYKPDNPFFWGGSSLYFNERLYGNRCFLLLEPGYKNILR